MGPQVQKEHGMDDSKAPIVVAGETRHIEERKGHILAGFDTSLSFAVAH